MELENGFSEDSSGDELRMFGDWFDCLRDDMLFIGEGWSRELFHDNLTDEKISKVEFDTRVLLCNNVDVFPMMCKFVSNRSVFRHKGRSVLEDLGYAFDHVYSEYMKCFHRGTYNNDTLLYVDHGRKICYEMYRGFEIECDPDIISEKMEYNFSLMHLDCHRICVADETAEWYCIPRCDWDTDIEVTKLGYWRNFSIENQRFIKNRVKPNCTIVCNKGYFYLDYCDKEVGYYLPLTHIDSIEDGIKDVFLHENEAIHTIGKHTFRVHKPGFGLDRMDEALNSFDNKVVDEIMSLGSLFCIERNDKEVENLLADLGYTYNKEISYELERGQRGVLSDIIIVDSNGIYWADYSKPKVLTIEAPIKIGSDIDSIREFLVNFKNK